MPYLSGASVRTWLSVQSLSIDKGRDTLAGALNQRSMVGGAKGNSAGPDISQQNVNKQGGIQNEKVRVIKH